MKASRWPAVLPCVAALCVGAAAVSPVHADDLPDHDRARAALKAGEVLPLQEVLDRLQRSHPGEVLEVELEREDGRWIYEFKLLQSGGRLLRLDVDARTATVLRSRQRPAPDGAGRPASVPERRP
ncbi:PepSY domain-containing protein [Roseateles sp. BYS78W]|uniref:PepSY domain-containing protein n=1 Tax=Pelomonas candidula TaxID=3299025 RepID=A0ABW7HHA4_9BURK